jgi:TonB-dependent receptor
MKNNHVLKKIILFVIIVFAGSLTAIYGQNAAKGGITGKVVDADTKEPLIGASVFIKGTTIGSGTDQQGIFMISGIPETKVILVVSYMGYKPFDKELVINQNDYINVNIELELDREFLEEVVVSGYSEAQRSALNQQKSADNIKNIISSDLIGRFPDLNVAEALQRVSGVNISRNRGEGSTISLRGTPQHFTSININGEQIPSSQSDGSRNESLDLIPADQLAFIEVTKALTPDMDGDAIGGTVNLKTPVAFRLKPYIKVEAGGGYSALAEGFNAIGRAKYAQRFFPTDRIKDGRLGVILGYSYYGASNTEDRVDAEWSAFDNIPIINLKTDTTVMQNFEYRDLMNQRIRTGATATIDFKFNETNSIIFKFMQNHKTDKDVRNRMTVFLNESAGIQFVAMDTFSGTELRRDIDIMDEINNNYTYNLSGEHTLGNAKIDWMGFYSTSTNTFTGLNGRFETADRYDLVATNPGGMYNDYVTFDLIDSEVSFYDPFLFNFVDRYEETDVKINAFNMVFKSNAEIPFSIGEHRGILKFGGKYRKQGNTKNTFNKTMQYYDPNQFLNVQQSFASLVSDYEDEDYFNNKIRFGPSIDENKFREFVDYYGSKVFVYDTVRTDRDSYNNTYDVEEDIYAGYLMSRVNFNKLLLLTGFRYEANFVKYDAWKVYSQSGAHTPLSDSRTYSYILPNFHSRYKFNDLTYLRSSVTWSYARPNFIDLVPFLSIQEDGSSMRAGNPDLEASSAQNFDLLFEKYFENNVDVGIFSVGAFYKNINKFQFKRHLQHLEPGDPYYEDFPFFSFEQEQNGENAKVYGAEFNFQSQLSFLPGIFNGIGVYLNYTLTESDAFTYDRSDINLPGQAKHTANGAITFDYKGFTSKVSANYNGEFLDGVAGEAINDIFQASRLQIDVNTSLQINKHWQIYAEFLNVTDAPTIKFQGIRERIYSYRYFGWWNRFGVSYRF